MTDDRELATMMHRGMTAQAERAPDPAALTERILGSAANAADLADLTTPNSADRSATPGTRWSRRGWALPVLAAASVVAVSVGVLAANPVLRPDRRPSLTSSTDGPGGPPGGPVPAGFRSVDVSFVSASDGWALGSVPCKQDRCTTLVRTRDGGASWRSVPAPPLAVPGGIMIDPVLSGCNTIVCVSGVRFASAQIGYIYNDWQLFVTVDGGSTWRPQSGGGSSLAVADGTVWRIADLSPERCSANCPVRLQSAPVGSQSWHDLALPAATPGGTGADLKRNGRTAVVVIDSAPAGEPTSKQNVQSGHSTVLTSTDSGATWTLRGEPCQRGGIAADSGAAAVAPDGSISVLCRPRNGDGGNSFMVSSADGGATFTASAELPGGVDDAVGAASAAVQFAVTDQLYRSGDSGKTWQRVSLGGATSARTFLVEFRTTTAGHVLIQDAAGASPTIWTTTDAGLTWTGHSFG